MNRRHWLKALGHVGGPLERMWLEDRPVSLHRTGFPRRPRMDEGDRLIYYAPVWRRVFAAVEVIEPPEARPASAGSSSRWPWSVAVEPLLLIPDLDIAPPVEAIGIAPRSMSQQSHILLSPEHYAQAVEVIASVAA